MRKAYLLIAFLLCSAPVWAWNLSGWAPGPGFQQNGSNVTLIESNSNVGIGSTNPRGRLDVDGIIYVDAIYGDGSNLTGVSGISGLTTGYVPKASSSTAVADSAIYQNGTNIGVGTTVPQSRLMVDGGVYPTVDNVYDLGSASYSWKDLYVDGVAYIAQASVAGSNPSTFTGNYVAVGTEGTRTYADGIGDVYVQNDLEVDGNVYIGAPVIGGVGMGGAGDLAVAGDVEIDGVLYADGVIYGAVFSAPVYVFKRNAAKPGLYVSSTGNVGINTTVVGQRLTVQGTINVQNGTNNGQGLILTGGFSDEGIIRTGGEDKHLYIMSTNPNQTGNVSIGTTDAPSAKLVVGPFTKTNVLGTKSVGVGGDIEVDGKIYVDGGLYQTQYVGIASTSPVNLMQVRFSGGQCSALVQTGTSLSVKFGTCP